MKRALSADEIHAKLNSLPAEGRYRTKGILYSNLGDIFYREGRAEEAAYQFELALQQDTSVSLRRHIYLYLGKSYESFGRLEKAIDAYEKAAQYDPKNWKRHRDVAGLYDQARLYPQAISSLEEAVRLSPREASLWYSLGHVWRKRGVYSKSLYYFKRSLSLKADPRRVAHELSFLFEGQGQYAEAARAWEESEKETLTPESLGRSIFLYTMAGNKEEAQKAIAKMKAIPGLKETAFFYENLLEFTLKKPEQILSASPRNPTLQNLLESVRSSGKRTMELR